MRFLLAMSLSLLGALASAQEVYKWKDANGVTHYGDKPVGTPNAAVADLPALQIYGLSNGKKPSPSAAPYGGNGPHVEITQPAADAVLTEAGDKFTVGIAVSPALAAGQSLVYYLDGAAQNRAPTTSSSFQFSRARNGDHMVSVAVVDDSGRELSRSEPVIVHLKPRDTAAQAAPKKP